jgi:hypothetical protein
MHAASFLPPNNGSPGGHPLAGVQGAEPPGLAKVKSHRGLYNLPVALAVVFGLAGPARADPQGDFSRAVADDLAGDQAHAFALYLNAARAGVSDAQFNVAVMYDSGRGTGHDAAQAALFYAFAATDGNARAAYNLGLLYESGDGVPRNLAVARAWYRKAAEAGLQAATQKLRASGVRLAAEAVDEGVQPAFPADNARLDAGNAAVPFVWVASPGAAPGLYYVQVVRLDGAVWQDVLTRVADVSATRAAIGALPGKYAWRVFSFSPTKAAYHATRWVRFSVIEAQSR